MVLFIFLTMGSGMFLIAWSIGLWKENSIYLAEARPNITIQDRIRSLMAPLSALGTILMERFKLTNTLRNKLDSAKVKMAPSDFMGLKIGCSIAGAVIGLMIPPTPEILNGAIGMFMGYAIPDVWVKQKIRKRKEEICRVMPETIDLIGLCVEAGLDFMTASKWVIEKSRPNPFLEELAIVLEEIRWGRSRAEALKEMSKRLNISEVSTFVHTLVQADRLGTSISETFNILSEDTREQRFRRGERFALKAPLKILIPLVFFILPVIAIIVGGPVMLQFMTGTMFNMTGG